MAYIHNDDTTYTQVNVPLANLIELRICWDILWSRCGASGWKKTVLRPLLPLPSRPALGSRWGKGAESSGAFSWRLSLERRYFRDPARPLARRGH